MNILAGLETFLYVISSVLLFPVVAGLTALTLWVIVYFGSFLREYLERRRGYYSSVERYKRMLVSEVSLSTVNGSLDINLERLLQDAELGLIKSLDLRGSKFKVQNAKLEEEDEIFEETQAI